MLKITRSTDPIRVEQIVICIYSPPGIGKTSLGFTADDPLLIDFDGGAYRAANRRDSVPVKSWTDVASMTADDLRDYKTIVVDTAGRALDVLSTDIIARDTKMGRGGTLTLQGYGKLKGEFGPWLKMLRSFGADIVLLAHADEQRNGDDVIERIDAQGGSKNEIYKSSDAMGRLAIRDGKRVLLFSPSDTAFGKNPAGLPPLEVPVFDAGSRFLGDVIRRIKDQLNTLTAEQQEVAQLLGDWRARAVAAATGKAMTALVGEIEGLDARIRENAKRVLWDHARGHGFCYDKAKGFVEKAEAAA